MREIVNAHARWKEYDVEWTVDELTGLTQNPSETWNAIASIHVHTVTACGIILARIAGTFVDIWKSEENMLSRISLFRRRFLYGLVFISSVASYYDTISFHAYKYQKLPWNRIEYNVGVEYDPNLIRRRWNRTVWMRVIDDAKSRTICVNICPPTFQIPKRSPVTMEWHYSIKITEHGALNGACPHLSDTSLPWIPGCSCKWTCWCHPCKCRDSGKDCWHTRLYLHHRT